MYSCLKKRRKERKWGMLFLSSSTPRSPGAYEITRALWPRMGRWRQPQPRAQCRRHVSLSTVKVQASSASQRVPKRISWSLTRCINRLQSSPDRSRPQGRQTKRHLGMCERMCCMWTVVEWPRKASLWRGRHGVRTHVDLPSPKILLFLSSRLISGFYFRNS